MADNREQVKDRPELTWDDSFGDHIRILDGIVGHQVCDGCIDMFNELEQRGLCHTRRDLGAHIGQRADTAIYCTEMDAMVNTPMQQIGDWIHNDVIESWQIRYPIVDSGIYAGLYNAQIKMQKTRPTEGYHNWHFEGGATSYDRTSILAWMVYLNDIEEGGETEFLYQGVRVPPVKGRLAVWPAGFTHVHRGNPPLKETKYAITGWINYVM